MYSYITVKIYSVNIIENRCTFVENKNEFLSRFHNRKRVRLRIYYGFIPTTQIICTVDIIYTTYDYTSLRVCTFESVGVNSDKHPRPRTST